MAQRFGAVFAVAIGSTVFTSYGGLGGAATVTAGFRPALAVCSVFAGLAALAATAMAARQRQAQQAEPVALSTPA
jgi:hypothetical protein